jgi:hypothetical protein
MRTHIIILFCFIGLLTPLTAHGSGTLTGASNAMNPALSVNALFVAETSNDRDDAEVNGVRFMEAEMQFTAVVDPFWTANAIFAMEPHEDDASAFEIGVEVANIEATSLPWGVGLKLGKFFLPFGKHAPLHTHQFAFVAAPVGVVAFLGEGLSETGAELGYALPLPWYSDLIVYVVNGDTGIWDGDDRDPVFGARLSNVLDVSDDATLELGGSFLAGPGSTPRLGFAGDYRVSGVDLTYKWISSSRSHGPALNLTAEALFPDLESHDGSPLGWYVTSQYRFHHNWWLGLTHGRVDTDEAGAPATFDGIGETWESKLNFTYAPSEFSAMRVEVSQYDDRLGDGDDLRFSLQWNFTIGSHPAHTY